MLFPKPPFEFDALSNPSINIYDTTFSDGYLGSSIDEERSKV
jgi:hypothetical protein